MSEAHGILQVVGRAGFLRRRQASYRPERSDLRVDERLIRQHDLRTGDEITGTLRNGKQGASLERVLSVNEVAPEALGERPAFSSLTAIHPDSRLRLEFPAPPGSPSLLSNRLIDLLSPVGKGQRALIVAPAKGGKTMVLQGIAEGVHGNYPEARLFILLVDERPEEVFEMEAAGVGEVIASSFDHPPAEHVAAAELVLERARRQVEHGRDVVLIVDSITRLARAHNAVDRGTGRTLSGGMDSQALERPKRFFGSARQVSASLGGGSLTVIATALIETGSKMDQVIFEEFKGTGNSELLLSRELAERRVFPAIDLLGSGTRKEELLLTEQELAASRVLRQRIARMTPLDALNSVLTDMKRHPTNAALVAALAP